MIKLTAAKDDAGRRLDRVIRKALPDCSLSLIHRLFRQKKISVDNRAAKPDTRLEQGMRITVHADVNSSTDEVNEKLSVNHKKNAVNRGGFTGCLPQILWQGAGIIVFNKPRGLATHGPDSLDSIVGESLACTLPRSLSFKPGPLHRLDKPTSGIIVFSQTLEGAKLFSALLREHRLEKTYLAIVEGDIESEKGKVKSEKSKDGDIIWRDALEHDKDAHKTSVIPCSSVVNSCAKEAITTVKTLASNNGYSLIEARIITGRHHQIRAQAASHGHPLAGDGKYGGKPLPGNGAARGAIRGGGFYLHAWKLSFPAEDIPAGFPHVITAPLPEEFRERIKKLGMRKGKN